MPIALRLLKASKLLRAIVAVSVAPASEVTAQPVELHIAGHDESSTHRKGMMSSIGLIWLNLRKRWRMMAKNKQLRGDPTNFCPKWAAAKRKRCPLILQPERALSQVPRHVRGEQPTCKRGYSSQRPSGPHASARSVLRPPVHPAKGERWYASFTSSPDMIAP